MASSDSNNLMFQQQQPSGNTNNHSPNNHRYYPDGGYELSPVGSFDISQTNNASLGASKRGKPAPSPTDSESLGDTSVHSAPSQPVLKPDSPGETSVQIYPDLLGNTSVQPPSSQLIVDPKSPPIISDIDKKNIKWQNIVLTFCFTTAIGIAIQSTDKNSQFPPSFQWLSLANVLTFSALFVAKFVGKVSPTAAKVLEQAAILLAATIFFLATAASSTQHFKYVTWAIYVVTMIVVLAFRVQI